MFLGLFYCIAECLGLNGLQLFMWANLKCAFGDFLVSCVPEVVSLVQFIVCAFIISVQYFAPRALRLSLA